jgi:hypothetical protein
MGAWNLPPSQQQNGPKYSIRARKISKTSGVPPLNQTLIDYKCPVAYEQQ